MGPMFGNQNYGGARPNFGQAVKTFFSKKTILNYLLIANIAVWVLVALVQLGSWLFKSDFISLFIGQLTIPASLSALAKRPWTVLTYMFLHQRFWHLFFNMWMLYFGGMIFVRFLSEKKMLWTYVLGGLTGALFFVLAYNLFPVFEEEKYYAVALGASASVLAILVAAAAYQPNYELRLFLFGTMKFKWLALIFVVLDLLSISNGNAGGHLAHLGGAFFGFIYGFLLRKDVDWSKLWPFHRKGGMKYTRYKEVKPKRSRRSHKPEPASRPMSDEEYNRRRAETEHAMDVILDKISKSGYASLTEEEKAFLFKNSKK